MSELEEALNVIIKYCKEKEETNYSCISCPLSKWYETRQPQCCILHMISRPSELKIFEN